MVAIATYTAEVRLSAFDDTALVVVSQVIPGLEVSTYVVGTIGLAADTDLEAEAAKAVAAWAARDTRGWEPGKSADAPLVIRADVRAMVAAMAWEAAKAESAEAEAAWRLASRHESAETPAVAQARLKAAFAKEAAARSASYLASVAG